MLLGNFLPSGTASPMPALANRTSRSCPFPRLICIEQAVEVVEIGRVATTTPVTFRPISLTALVERLPASCP